MILDSSAVIAIFFQEPEYNRFLTKLATAEWIGIGAPTLVECSIVLCARMKLDAQHLLHRFLREAHVIIIPFTDVPMNSRWGRGLPMAKDAIPLP